MLRRCFSVKNGTKQKKPHTGGVGFLFIVTKHALAGCDEGIRINKPTHGGVIVAGLQLVQLGLLVVNISAVTQRFIAAQCRGHAASSGQQASPCVVGVAYHLLAAGVDNGNHIALQIGGVVIGGVIVNDRQRISVGIIVEVQDFIANGHMGQLGTVIKIRVGGCAVGTLGAHAVGVVSEVPGGAAFGHAGKLPAVDPCIVPCAVRQRITDGIIGNGFAIVGCQQIAPLCVAIDIIDSTYNCAQRAGGIGIGF